MLRQTQSVSMSLCLCERRSLSDGEGFAGLRYGNLKGLALNEGSSSNLVGRRFFPDVYVAWTTRLTAIPFNERILV